MLKSYTLILTFSFALDLLSIGFVFDSFPLGNFELYNVKFFFSIFDLSNLYNPYNFPCNVNLVVKI